MIPDEELDRRVKHGRLLALMFLVVMPLVYLIIAFVLKTERFSPDEGSQRFPVYVLLIVAFLEPVVSVFVRKFQVKNYRQTKGKAPQPGPLAFNKGRTEMTPGQFFINVLITQLSFVAAVFVLGLIAYLITAELNNMAYFYALGIVWSFVFWPREEKAKNFMKSLEEI